MPLCNTGYLTLGKITSFEIQHNSIWHACMLWICTFVCSCVLCLCVCMCTCTHSTLCIIRCSLTTFQIYTSQRLYMWWQLACNSILVKLKNISYIVKYLHVSIEYPHIICTVTVHVGIHHSLSYSGMVTCLWLSMFVNLRMQIQM